jgi:hypothetical protein
VEFNKGDCRWFVTGKAEEVRRTDERSMILQALLEAGEPMSPVNIAAATGMKPDNVRQLLFKMTRAGEVVKHGTLTVRASECYRLGMRVPPITTITSITFPTWPPKRRMMNRTDRYRCYHCDRPLNDLIITPVTHSIRGIGGAVKRRGFIGKRPCRYQISRPCRCVFLAQTGTPWI